MRTLRELAGYIDWERVCEWAVMTALCVPVVFVLWLLYIGLWVVLG